MGWLDSGQLANGLLQQEAGSGHQIFWGLWKKFSHAPSQCNKSKIKKLKLLYSVKDTVKKIDEKIDNIRENI